MMKMKPILRHKRWISASLVLVLLFSLLASFPVFGGSLDSNNKFDINLSSYPNHNYFSSNPSWKFQKIAGMGNENIAKYNILTDPVQAVTVTEQGGTGLYIRIDDKGNKDNGWSLRLINESKITAPPGVDATLSGEAGVPQATDLVKDMYHSYWWILNNVITHKDSRGNVTVDQNYDQYVFKLREPVSGGREVEVPYISWDFLDGITAFINKETTNGYFYWQGKYTNGPDTYEVIYRGISSTKQTATNYGITNFRSTGFTGFKPTGSAGAGIEKGTVQLEFMAEVQYKDVHVLKKNATYWFNHYTNVGISEYSVAASKTMLSGDKKKSDSVVGNLDILEQNDTLTIRLFSSINTSKAYFPNLDYYNSHQDEFKVERRNPAVFAATEVPYMVFVASYMPKSERYPNEIDTISIRDVLMQQPGKIIPTSAVSATPFINVTLPTNSQYILIVPILNPYRFYEDIVNDKTGTLKNAFILKLKGGDNNSGTLKILQQMESDYTAKGMTFLFDKEAIADTLADDLYKKIIGKIEKDYTTKKNSGQLDKFHTQNVGNGRAKILYGDRLFPSNTDAQKQIIQTTRKAIEDVVVRKKDPLKVFGPSSGYENEVKQLYDDNTSIQDIVDAYFKGDWRNILVLPYKVKQPDAITVKITDTGISPKVDNALAGAGKSEYESKAITDPSYAIPGKIYTARYSITNNSDQPITSLALRYYVVSTKPDGVGHPKIFESKPIGVFYGTEYTFSNYLDKDGKPKTVNSYVPYYAGTNSDGESFETLHSKINDDPYMKLKEENGGTWPELIQTFIDPGETVEGTFLWKMPDATQNPSKDPVVLYVTAALKLDKNANMKGTGSGEINSHFQEEELNYYPDQSPAMFFSFTPNQIMARHVEDTNVNNLRDSRTIAARLDSYVPNPKDPFDPIAYPPDKLQDKQTFLRYTTTENISYQEYDEWVEDGYWIERQPLIVRYKRTQWIVR
ncbi:hypothetical protein [Thermicanus aegyptius]|uniref:hypothetical protein n=1 Tax=Thermicanus aegyptius TaxID=94009 RepID=UPI00042611FE|nr:hypothetical protein [Thermicanus aegyptius]